MDLKTDEGDGEGLNGNLPRRAEAKLSHSGGLIGTDAENNGRSGTQPGLLLASRSLAKKTSGMANSGASDGAFMAQRAKALTGKTAGQAPAAKSLLWQRRGEGYALIALEILRISLAMSIEVASDFE